MDATHDQKISIWKKSIYDILKQKKNCNLLMNVSLYERNKRLNSESKEEYNYDA